MNTDKHGYWKRLGFQCLDEAEAFLLREYFVKAGGEAGRVVELGA